MLSPIFHSLPAPISASNRHRSPILRGVQCPRPICPRYAHRAPCRPARIPSHPCSLVPWKWAAVRDCPASNLPNHSEMETWCSPARMWVRSNSCLSSWSLACRQPRCTTRHRWLSRPWTTSYRLRTCCYPNAFSDGSANKRAWLMIANWYCQWEKSVTSRTKIELFLKGPITMSLIKKKPS